jgi:hypothetical protein
MVIERSAPSRECWCPPANALGRRIDWARHRSRQETCIGPEEGAEVSLVGLEMGAWIR